VSVFAFDCAGSGRSDGEFVTLGWGEQRDLADVIAFLRASGEVSTIALWGRSMGAATALLHAHRDPSVAAIVLDSPFADLRRLCSELVGVGSASMGIDRRLLTLALPLALRLVRNSVKARSGMDLFDLKPIEHVAQAHVPALFCAGRGDDFVSPRHAADIYKAYGSADVFKALHLVDGDHNSIRPAAFLNVAGGFLRRALSTQPAHERLSAPLALRAAEAEAPTPAPLDARVRSAPPPVLAPPVPQAPSLPPPSPAVRARAVPQGVEAEAQGKDSDGSSGSDVMLQLALEESFART
jgi:alpha-beta hydrolase superfamily lysophospholipase